MIEKIGIKNYQSLHNVSLEMGKFTVIFGDSDVGKSAVYRAIRGLVTAEDGDAFITEGKPKVGVSIMTPTTEVVWLKSRGKSSTYHLYQDGVKNGEWNRARSLPIDLAKILRFEQMVVDGDKFFPNFRGQFDPLFMLFESSGKRARLLGSLVSNLLLRGIKVANLERNRVEADIRAMSGLAETLEAKLEVDWGALETKAISTSKFTCNLEKQVNSLVQVEALIKEREIVQDALVLEEDVLSSYPRVFYEMDVYISGLKKIGELKLLNESRDYYTKALAVEFNLPPEEDFDKAIRMEEMLEWLGSKMTYCRAIERDMSLSTFEIKRLQKEIQGLDKDIIKLEVDTFVKCPYCQKEFEL
jgi:energy-coupling factor transporter ATP-binding protein EcfA2